MSAAPGGGGAGGAGGAGAGLRQLRRGEPGYPALLAAIHDPPDPLWLRGSAPVSLLSLPAVAVVGSRACSPYGAQVARLIGREVAAAGGVVVSGLARGVDAEAHRGALEAGGPTVAVLGCGIDRDYPASHATLAARIAESGLVVSEYEPGVEPAPWQFPARNRIIAGLCKAVVIVEARERSGALITAGFATQGGRDVFAVPGEITSSLSRGTNELLRDGAAPLLSPDDVLAELGLVPVAWTAPLIGSDAALVLAALGAASATADEIGLVTRLRPGALAAALAELEVAGHIVEAAGRFRVVGVRT